MYRACFGLSQRPFAPIPAAGQYFPAEAIEAARQTITRCVQRAEGAAMVVGPSGTGKTLLFRVLADQFRPTLAVALLGAGRLGTRSALYQAILYELHRTYRGMDEGELRLALVDYLTTCDDRPDGLVLLVDEAHTLPLRLLDEIRMLTNLVGSGQSRVRVVLAGGPTLEERFASPKLEAFSQRLAARCYLEPFGRTETQYYMRAQIKMAGGDAVKVFTDDACEAVFRATDGVPRLINQVCDHALVLAAAQGKSRIDGRTVEEAWADLQQLPTPWNDDTPRSSSGGPSSGSVVEFGALDDELSSPREPASPRAVAAASSTPALDDDLFDGLGASLDASEAVVGLDDEPVDQIERIEKTLNQLDELDRAHDAQAENAAFQPAGTIRPEIELTFADTGNPFDEPYLEEEVIRQRYDSIRPRTKTVAARVSEDVSYAIPMPPRTTPPTTVAGEPLPLSAIERLSTPTSQPTLPAAAVQPAAAIAMPKQEPFPATVPWASPESVALDDQGPARGRPRITVGRPSQYKRLFTKLRQG